MALFRGGPVSALGPQNGGYRLYRSARVTLTRPCGGIPGGAAALPGQNELRRRRVTEAASRRPHPSGRREPAGPPRPGPPRALPRTLRRGLTGRAARAAPPSRAPALPSGRTVAAMSRLLLLRALRAARPGPGAFRAARCLRTAAPRPAFAKELFLGTLRKVRGPLRLEWEGGPSRRRRLGCRGGPRRSGVPSGGPGPGSGGVGWPRPRAGHVGCWLIEWRRGAGERGHGECPWLPAERRGGEPGPVPAPAAGH